MAQGPGLGLSIVERLVTAMGLELEPIESKGRASRYACRAAR
jgi:signal transduction histidine kinase